MEKLNYFIDHFFLAHPEKDSTWLLPALVRNSQVSSQESGIGKGDFDGLPEYPADCIEGQSLRPIVEINQQEFKDEEGGHSFRLYQLKRSLVAVFAGVPEQEVEAFCRRWSQHWIYSPFQGWQHLPKEVAQERCRDMAFQKLHPFLKFFRPLCLEALATGKGVYLLHEWHGAVNYL